MFLGDILMTSDSVARSRLWRSAALRLRLLALRLRRLCAVPSPLRRGARVPYAHQRVQAAGGPDVDAVQGARREDHDVAGRQREAAAVAEALALACSAPGRELAAPTGRTGCLAQAVLRG